MLMMLKSVSGPLTNILISELNHKGKYCTISEKKLCQRQLAFYLLISYIFHLEEKTSLKENILSRLNHICHIWLNLYSLVFELIKFKARLFSDIKNNAWSYSFFFRPRNEICINIFTTILHIVLNFVHVLINMNFSE